MRVEPFSRMLGERFAMAWCDPVWQRHLQHGDAVQRLYEEVLHMAIAQRVRQHMQAASWIRGMFEEGLQLKQQYGADNVYDFSLGNPVLEPPPQFYEALHQLVTHPQPGMHRYMPNVGYPETRAAIATQLARVPVVPIPGLDLARGQWKRHNLFL